MRIISGRAKGKRLVGPPDAETTRPIPDRVKQSLFNLLRGHFEGARVVDLFAGTGGIGLEAWSRGAERVLFVERDRKIVQVLERNLEGVGRPVECEVMTGDALGPSVLSRCPSPLTLVFADPPYPLVRDPEGWGRVREQFMRLIDRLSDDGFAVLRTPWPFLHRADGPQKEEGRLPRTVVVDLDRDGDEAIDAFEASLAAGAAGSFAEVPLEFENAEGPETHAYGTTAIHLYMRKRDA